ncbi:MAG TPA: hypothetical protein VHK00_01700 [Miltoncostaeaceae bacterium]|jgi:hypothetical protein|nr:hypothetical protein [Miltoncostaeaceae bacterium]
MPKPLARWLVALAATALLAGWLPGAATATRPSTQAEIDGILAAVQRSPLLAKIPGRPFIVTQITISTASASPLYASGVVSPRKVSGRRRAPIELLFRQDADGSWALLDFGHNFCGDADVPGPVLRDLFDTSCGGSGGGSHAGKGFAVLGTAVAGPTTVKLIAVRGAPRGRVQPGSVFLAVAVNRRVVVEQTVGRALGFNWNLLNRPGGGGVIALASAGGGPQYITVTVRKSASAYGTQSYTFASGVLLPARGTLPPSS